MIIKQKWLHCSSPIKGKVTQWGWTDFLEQQPKMEIFLRERETYL